MSSEHTAIQKTIILERNYQVDNIRFILIVLMVFGHLLNSFSGQVSSQVYRIIYSFHMPTFIYISGLYSSFSLRRILKHLLLPYVVFQILYHLFRCLLTNRFSFKITFTTPDWILWFLLSLIIYNLLIPVLDSVKTKHYPLIELISFVIAILVGFDTTVGNYLSLSRTIVFFPFFILGYYQKKGYATNNYLVSSTRLFRIPLLLLPLLIIIETALLIIQPEYSLFYCNIGYFSSMDILTRILILFCAFLWIKLLFTIVPTRRIPLITGCGEYTLPVYLLHGFLILWIRNLNFLHFSEPINVLSSIAITTLIMVIFNVPFIKNSFRKCF